MAVSFLTFLSALFGWVYFLAWGASFYPQAMLNWSRRTTSGTTVDFPFINVLGESAQLFKSPEANRNLAYLLAHPTLQSYNIRHPTSPNSHVPRP